MGLFRRRKEDETLNEQMLREAGLEPLQGVLDDPADPDQPQEPSPPPLPEEYAGTALAGDSAGIVLHAFEEPGDWDVVITVNAELLTGHYADFAVLEDGRLVVVEGSAKGDLAPFLAAIAHRLRPPYRALARRQDHELWSVAARQIEVIELDADGAGTITVESNDGTRVTRVDGTVSDQRFPVLEGAGRAEAADYTVLAERIDGGLWGARATAL